MLSLTHRQAFCQLHLGASVSSSYLCTVYCTALAQDGPEAEVKMYAAKSFDQLSGDATLSRAVWEAALPVLAIVLQVGCWIRCFWQQSMLGGQKA